MRDHTLKIRWPDSLCHYTDLESELHWYREAAKNNQPYALWRLGKGQYLNCQLFDACEHKNDKYLDQARAIWRQRAEQGDGEAMYQLGIRDLGWIKWIPYYNYQTRIKWMKKAIEHNYTNAIEELVHLLEKKKNDNPEILIWLRFAAEKGDPWAQNMMSKFAESREERLSWNQRAVAQRYSEAIYSLAFSYKNGRDVEKDLNKAAFYYCILSYNSTARMACSDIFKVLPEQEKEQVSAQVKDWLEHNTVYYFTDPLFD